MTKKDIDKRIIFKFNYFLKDYKNEFIGDIKERIFSRAFNAYIILESVAYTPPRVHEVINELVKLHIGISREKINELSQRMAHNNISTVVKQLDKVVPLTPEEEAMVTKYYSYLFGDFQRNPDPFNHIKF